MPFVEPKLIGYTCLFNFGTFTGFFVSNNGLETAVMDIKSIEGSVLAVPARIVALVRLRHLSRGQAQLTRDQNRAHLPPLSWEIHRIPCP